jgi:hypothetical protein
LKHLVRGALRGESDGAAHAPDPEDVDGAHEWDDEEVEHRRDEELHDLLVQSVVRRHRIGPVGCEGFVHRTRVPFAVTFRGLGVDGDARGGLGALRVAIAEGVEHHLAARGCAGNDAPDGGTRRGERSPGSSDVARSLAAVDAATRPEGDADARDARARDSTRGNTGHGRRESRRGESCVWCQSDVCTETMCPVVPIIQNAVMKVGLLTDLLQLGGYVHASSMHEFESTKS